MYCATQSGLLEQKLLNLFLAIQCHVSFSFLLRRRQALFGRVIAQILA